MATHYTPHDGSVAAQAIAALQEFGGPMSTGVLCEEIGAETKQIHQLLAAALRHGAIIKTVKIVPGMRGGKQTIFSLPAHGLSQDPPPYGDAKERAQDEAEAGLASSIDAAPKPAPAPAQKKPPAVAAAKPKSAEPVPAPAAPPPVPAVDLAAFSIEYQPLAQPSRRPAGYWAERLAALASAPINGSQLPTLRLPSEKHKAADSALRSWRKATKPSAELVCTRMPDYVLIQRVA